MIESTDAEPSVPAATLVSACILDDASPALASCVDSLLQAVEAAPGQETEVMVFSRTPSASFGLDEAVRRFPGLRIIVLPWLTHRIDMLNYAVRKASGRFVLLLNSDILAAPDLISRIAGYASKVNLFGLTFEVRTLPVPSVFDTRAEPSGGTPVLGRTSFSDDGLGIDLHPGTEKPAPALFAFAGIGCFRRDALLKLNGFSRVYRFLAWGFCADLDLCYRAWQAGFGTLYAPELKVWRYGFRNPGAFYNPMPSAESEPFADRFAWNVLYRLFRLRHGIRAPLGARISGFFRNLDVLRALTSFLAGIMALFHRAEHFGLRQVYGYMKIREMTMRDSL